MVGETRGGGGHAMDIYAYGGYAWAWGPYHCMGLGGRGRILKHMHGCNEPRWNGSKLVVEHHSGWRYPWGPDILNQPCQNIIVGSTLDQLCGNIIVVAGIRVNWIFSSHHLGT